MRNSEFCEWVIFIHDFSVSTFLMVLSDHNFSVRSFRYCNLANTIYATPEKVESNPIQSTSSYKTADKTSENRQDQ